MCMAESLCCSPETIQVFTCSYTSIQNKKLFFFLNADKSASYMNKIIEQDLHKRGPPNGQQAREKMFNLISHEGMPVQII